MIIMHAEDKVRKAQVRLFHERVRPNIDLLTEGVNIVRGIKGLKNSVTKNEDVKWSDTIQFSHPKISDISIWNAFVEKYGHFLQFETNPLENKLGFFQELHDMIERLNRSRVTPNNFVITRTRPVVDIESLSAREIAEKKVEDERKYPTEQFTVVFSLEWVVKA